MVSSAEDGAATLVRFTCESLTKSLSFIPSLPAQLLVTGGGRHNPTMIETLAKLSEIPVNPVETVGWDGDAIEAQAFAFLGSGLYAVSQLACPRQPAYQRRLQVGRSLRRHKSYKENHKTPRFTKNRI